MMQITELEGFETLLEDIAETARLIHFYGWAEANAGNLSLDVTKRVPKPKPEARYYIVTKTGSRYRQTALKPLENLLLAESVDGSFSFYPTGCKPTMEWQSHYCLHKIIGENKVVLHTHPAEIIALAALDIGEKELNATFKNILKELPLYLPQGFAIAAYHPPGSSALCAASQNALKNQKALVWSGHGLLCFGDTLAAALDYMEIIVKAAKVFWLIR